MLNNHLNKVNEIKTLLAEIESDNKIKIIHAVVVGSRQFETNKPDSDWDIRFIYVNDLSWYFKSNDVKKTLSGKTVDGSIEHLGLSMGEAISNIVKSNGNFYEWFSSPHVLISNSSAWFLIKSEMDLYYNPVRVLHFYHSVFETARREHAVEGFNLKRTLLMLRTVLSKPNLRHYGSLEQTLHKLVLNSQDIPDQIKKIINRWIAYRNTNDISLAPTEKEIEGVMGTIAYLTIELSDIKKYDYFVPKHREPDILDELHYRIATNCLN